MLNRKQRRALMRASQVDRSLAVPASSLALSAKPVSVLLQQRKKRRKLGKTKSFVTPGSRFSDSGQHRFVKAPQTKDYLKALTDPFFAPAPKLGFGTFVPTAKHTTWLERATNISATSTWAVVRCNTTVTAAATVYQGTGANVNSAISGAAQGIYNTTNQSTIVAMCQLGRIINWAVRVKIRANATALPGTLGLLYIPDETQTNIEALTPNNMVSLVGYRPCTASSVGQIGGEVQYRPADLVDFEFLSDYVSSTQVATGLKEMQMLVVATGWTAAAWDMEITLVGHIESLAGADQAGETDSEPDLVDGGATIDSLSSIIAQAGEPVRTSLEALQRLDDANNNINRIRAGHTLSGMMKNFASGLASNDVLLAPKEIGKSDYLKGSFDPVQLQKIIDTLKEERDMLARKLDIITFGDKVNKVHQPDTPVPSELSDYEEERKVTDEELSKMKLEKAQVVLSRSMFDTLLRK